MAQEPREILRDNAGALVSRKTRSTGTVVTLYDGVLAGMDCEGPNNEVWRWQTVCEAHGAIIAHRAKSTARGWLSHPEDWCEDCRAKVE